MDLKAHVSFRNDYRCTDLFRFRLPLHHIGYWRRKNKFKNGFHSEWPKDGTDEFEY